MSTTALHIIELIKSLPMAEQRAICEALAQHGAKLRTSKHRPMKRLPDGTYFNPDGIPNDHPFFKILEEEAEARHRDAGPPAPKFD